MPLDVRPLKTWLAHRDRSNKPTLVVLHATAGSTSKSSIDHLRGAGLSYHYIIPRDDRDSAKHESSNGSSPFVWHCVPNNKHAFHVGSTIPPPKGSGSINKNSIGISLANIQRVKNPEPYPKAQLAVLEELIAKLMSDTPELEFLTAHAVVQPWNRADPSSVDWPAIARRAGLKFWKPTKQQVDEHKP